MRIGPVVGACALLALAGCSGGTFSGLDQANTSGDVAGARLTGSVHGGQQAIVGAHVYLFAANTTGYGGAGIAASASNASLSLLTSGAGRTLDSSGGATNGDYYVTTDANGGFSITGDYTCVQNSQVYLYALGGNPGSGPNTAAGLMAVLGNCPAAGTFSSSLFVSVNEVSTVAAAYAMAGFATDATHVSSSGTALALTGIANAFANAGNLVDLPTGVALATTPAGNGTVPQAEINTLGNVLAACVNSTGASSSACSTLLTNALSGGTTGIQPTDAATAAINMAHNPVANLASLYALAAATPPFGPALTVQPNDFSVALRFAGAGLNLPSGVAVDAIGNIWIANYSGNSVTELSSTGNVLSGSSGYPLGISPGSPVIDPFGNVWMLCGATLTKLSGTGSIMSGPNGYGGLGLYPKGSLAIDGLGNIWVANGGDNTVTKISNLGVVLSGAGGYSNGGIGYPYAVAVDGGGNVWIANYSSSSVSKLTNSGVLVSGPTGYTNGGLSYPGPMAIDSLGNVWLTDEYPAAPTSGVSKFSNSGTALSGTAGYIGGTLDAPTAIAIDGAGNAFVPGFGPYIVEMSNSGAILSGSTGFKETSVLFATTNVAVDGSGNVWTAGTVYPFSKGNVTEFVGLGAPVVTPISAGLPATPTVDGSSKLGTRP